MDKVLGFIGTFLLVLLFLLLFLIVLLFIVCISHPKIIIKCHDKLEILTKLWLFRFDVTKFISGNKKKKKPKIIHFDGSHFGELAVSEKKRRKKKSDKKTVPQHQVNSVQKESKTLSEKATEALSLVSDILDDVKEPMKKVIKVDVKRLYVTVSTDDPHKTALAFGGMNSAAGTLILVCKKFASLNIDENNVGVYCDFCAVKPSLDTYIVLTLSFRHIVVCSFKTVMRLFGK